MRKELLIYLKAWFEDDDVTPGWRRWFETHESELSAHFTRLELLRLKHHPAAMIPDILRAHEITVVVAEGAVRTPRCWHCGSRVTVIGQSPHVHIRCPQCGPILMT